MKARFLFTGLAVACLLTIALVSRFLPKEPEDFQRDRPSENQAPAPHDQADFSSIPPKPAKLSPPRQEEGVTPPAPLPPAPRSFIVTADLSRTEPASITVKKNTPTTLIFRVKTLNVPSALTFSGNGQTTGAIKPGQSGDLQFKAEAPFTVTAESEGKLLGYTLQVLVE